MSVKPNRLLGMLEMLDELPALFRQAIADSKGGGQGADQFYSHEGGTALDAAINEAMARVGVFLKVSRVYVMQLEDSGIRMRNTHEWVNINIGAAMPSWPLYDMRRDLPSLLPMLRQNGVVAGQANDMPADLARVLNMQDVASVINRPMFSGRELSGLVGFDVCQKARAWHKAEIALCGCLAEMVSLGLETQKLRSERLRMEQAKAALWATLAPPETRPEEGLTQARAMQASAPATPAPPAPPSPGTLQESELRLISETLARYNGNKSKAALHLGLSWPSLQRRLKKLGLA